MLPGQEDPEAKGTSGFQEAGLAPPQATQTGQRVRDHSPTCQATQQQPPPSSEIQRSLCKVVQLLNPLPWPASKGKLWGCCCLALESLARKRESSKPKGGGSQRIQQTMASSLPVRGHSISSVSGERPSFSCCQEIDSFLFLWAVC